MLGISTTSTQEIVNKTPILPDQSIIEKEAFELTKEAQRNCEKKCFIFELLKPREKRFQKAVELYQTSAEKYKSIKEWKKAGMSYENCGRVKASLDDNPITYYQESYNCYIKGDSDVDERRLVDELCLNLEKNNDFYNAGQYCEKYAINLQNKKKDSDAILYYNKALDYYEKDINNPQKDLLKVNIQMKLYDLMTNNNHPDAALKVPGMLDNLGTYCINNPTMKSSAKDYFGKSILTNIFYNNNPVEARNNLNKYKQMDNNFGTSPMYYLCHDIIDSMETNNVNKIKYSIQQYRQMNQVDEYTNNILGKMIEKSKISEF